MKKKQLNKETKQLEGLLFNLLFYVPQGKKLHAQIYNRFNEDVLIEIIIETQFEYDFILSAFLKADEQMKEKLIFK